MKKKYTTVGNYYGCFENILESCPGMTDECYEAIKDIECLVVDDLGTFITNCTKASYRKGFSWIGGSKHGGVPITKLGQGADGAKVFNLLYKYCINYMHEGEYTYTGSGLPGKGYGSCWLGGYWIRWPENGVGSELFFHVDNIYFGIVFGAKAPSRENPLTGCQAFSRFKTICKHHGIDLLSLMPEDPDAIKKQIPKAHIEFYGALDVTYFNVHHMDFNSAYFAGIYQDYPILRPAIDDVYRAKDIAKAKGDMDAFYMNKAILNNTQGFCQSEYTVYDCGKKYALSNLAYSALTWNNNMIDEYMGILKKNDRQVLATNTDGIYYIGKEYRDENYGTGLGQYKTDIVDCMIRFKSAGSYEYIENGIYYPVVRGYTHLDMIGIDRSQWSWGDIYKYEATTTGWQFFETEGWVLTDEAYI